MKQASIGIIGGGLTGLTLAYLLQQQGIAATIIEARDRIGGRIHTVTPKGDTPIEMGATWLGKQHTHLLQLLKDLEIGIFEQQLGSTAFYEPMSINPPQLVQLPPNSEPSYRIQGGSSRLIQTLADQLKEEQIQLSQVVQSIIQKDTQIAINTNKTTYTFDYVISTLPPFLLAQKIAIQPALPATCTAIMNNTHTWMGNSIKIGFRFKEPFWRTRESSGTIFSNVGPIPEFYEHANYEDNLFALKGFFNGAYAPATKAERLRLALIQLRKYYGQKVDEYTSYEELVWANEPYTFESYGNPILPHQHNGHSVYRQAYLKERFYIAGAETGFASPGYMNGAVESAYFVFGALNASW